LKSFITFSAGPIMSNVEVLFFAADPLSAAPDGTTRKLLLDEEVRQIRRKVRLAPFRKKLQFDTHGAARTGDLLDALIETRPQIVHFSGHGGHNGLVLWSANGGGARRVPPEGLKELFEMFPGEIRLVVLNACFSLEQARTIADIVGCAIGTPARIMDDAAITFAARFYRAIASGKSVQAAFDQARLALKLENCADAECPQLVCRAGVNPARLVLIPSRAKRIMRRVVAGFTTLVVSAGALAGGKELIDGPEIIPVVTPAGASAHPSSPSSLKSKLVAVRDFQRVGNHADAFPLIKEVADEGDAEAMGLLGIAYLNGEGTAPDPFLGVTWLRKAIDKRRDAAAMNALGTAFEEGRGERLSLRWARHWYLAAAEEKGYPEAMRNLGRLARGLGTESADREALAWFEKAAHAGSLDAMVDLGAMYEQGRPGIRDTAAALGWYGKAATAGSPHGMFAVGRAYENGIGTAQNYAQARAWYHRAAEKGSADAMNNLGVLHQYGRGAPADAAEARRWFRKAARAGSAQARAYVEALAAR
jgi:TPR repeat protein